MNIYKIFTTLLVYFFGTVFMLLMLGIGAGLTIVATSTAAVMYFPFIALEWVIDKSLKK